MKLIESPGTTPLEPEELEDLIPRFILTMSELNAFEADNILEAESWLVRKKPKISVVLQVKFLLELHKKMFSKTWKWAGQFRKTNKNIGCDKAYVAEELKKLLGDVQFWVDKQSFSNDKIAAKFHHRLVKIHPFPNGNGRHARMATDTLLRALGEAPFSWGTELSAKNEVKDRYIAALQAADRNNDALLFQFLQVKG